MWAFWVLAAGRWDETISCIFEQFFVIKWDQESDVKSAENQRNPKKNQRIQKIKNRILERVWKIISANWGLQIAEMIFQTRDSVGKEK